MTQLPVSSSEPETTKPIKPTKAKSAKRWFCWFSLLLDLFLLCGLACFGLWRWHTQQQETIQKQLIRFEQVREQYRPSDVWITDQKGIVLGSLRTTLNERSYPWMGLSEVPSVFVNLLVQAEDKNFYTHRGVDFKALAYAVVDFAKSQFGYSKHRGGASTLSMQLVRLLQQKKLIQNVGLQTSIDNRELTKKLIQIEWAMALEKHWSKQQILEAYLNLVPFRGEFVGLAAASQGLSAKQANGLDKIDSAWLIAMIRSPNAPAEKIKQRACTLLNQAEQIDCKTIPNSQISALERGLYAPYPILNQRELVPVFSDKIIDLTKPSAQNKEANITSTLRARVQNIALNAVREQLDFLKNQHVQDAAVLVLDNRSGLVIAYVGNGGADVRTNQQWSSALQIDGIQMRRQAGSTLKPFIYGLALEKRIITETSLIEDQPNPISLGNGLIYEPNNYDNQFKGVVSVSQALASSLNVPAVKMLLATGGEDVIELMKKLGFTQLQSADFYGPSLALGTVDISLWELTRAYQHLAQNTQIGLSRHTKQTLFDMLSSPENRALTFQTDSVLTLPFAAAVKTGTSKDMRDNWCVGWTKEYTVGVWVGNFNGDAMWQVSGITGAAPIWRRIMLALHSGGFGKQPIALTAQKNTNDQLNERLISDAKNTQISYPVQDSFIAQDPEIPEASQKILITIRNPQAGHSLWLDQSLLSESKPYIPWTLIKGRHEITLKNQHNKIIHQVNFEVR